MYAECDSAYLVEQEQACDHMVQMGFNHARWCKFHHKEFTQFDRLFEAFFMALTIDCELSARWGLYDGPTSDAGSEED